jgi:hypothetical protein
MVTEASLQALHLDHRVWLQSLLFIDEQLAFYRKRLLALADLELNPTLHARVEELQDHVDSQAMLSGQLHQQINEHEQELARIAQADPDAIEPAHQNAHAQNYERILALAGDFDKLQQQVHTLYLQQLL